MPAVSVIVPARDAARTIARALAALGAQRFEEEAEVIVVDDGSRDDTPALAEGSAGVSRVVRGAGEGPAAARNRGVAASAGEVLAFLDADCFPTPGWLAAGVAALERADLVQGAVRPDPEAQPGPFDRTLWVTAPSGLFESANLFVRREAFARAGGFESWLAPRRGIELGEDVLFGWRVRRAGGRTGFCEEALAHHAVFPRGVAAFVAERARLRFFPRLAARVPELREEAFYRRLFLSRRSALFDLAAVGALAATRRRAALLAMAPYAALVAREAAPWGPRAAQVAAAGAAADAVGAGALAVGSVAARSPLL